ncbi:hypothetical protein NUU61_001779 [Penicillium alfredii]|uniref:S-adenosyl-L-methionine-dependent methyltransferase n=1 Tax=Penicillium alfredii TaxID=1506179 RepID=A0A9W9KGN5_9EURO|nr:uncharacterized protein NUU61_001779 [Penicillium alfredii]KAJ5104432.1 hypothetical protein NUU61_001779 [Penicillium alfredii]
MEDKPIAVDPNPHLLTDDYDLDDWQSETTSIQSSIYKGLIENGRRYQSLRSSEYHVPSDDQQFEAYEAGHIVAMIMDAHQRNPLFQAPIGPSPKGKERGPLTLQTGSPMQPSMVWICSPPPVNWMPPNCILEVDDILQEWTWREPFDLVHLRILDSAFTPEETDRLYKQCYDHIRPGGWIEQFELSPYIECDDDSLPADNIVRGWGPRFERAAEKSGRPLMIMNTFHESIQKAGFVDVHTKDYKWPIGPWPRDRQLKEAGLVNFHHWMGGMEGYGLWLLTKFGDPVPWSNEEVQVYVAKVRREIANPRFHIYERAKRIWARKPFPDETRMST